MSIDDLGQGVSRVTRKINDLRESWTALDDLGCKDGGQGRDRTADAGLFRAALYH